MGSISPFHRGEQEVQRRVGVRDRAEQIGQRVIRDHLPDQHREFYQQLPMLLLGSVDERGRPWASVVTGEPGFLTTPDATTLSVAALPSVDDPLRGNMKPGADVGVLGIELQSRRRNRISGRFLECNGGGFAIEVAQAFGNCPRYIQKRQPGISPGTAVAGLHRVHRARSLSESDRQLIAAADTFFIASQFREADGVASQGIDVSHRGGKPGFVRVDDGQTFCWPDFAGNNHFNTLGNLLVNPRAGHLFIDFAAGDLLYLTGHTQIVWDTEETRNFDGAERLVRFHLDELVRIDGAMPIKWQFEEFSPALENTGSWAVSGRIPAVAENPTVE